MPSFLTRELIHDIARTGFNAPCAKGRAWARGRPRGPGLESGRAWARGQNNCGRAYPAISLSRLIILLALIGIAAPQALGAGAHHKQVPNAQPHRHAVIVTISGPIDLVQANAIDRRIRLAEAQHASMIIFRFRSSTGLIGPAISAAARIAKCKLATVAYIRTAAIGPALLLATACHQIIMHRAAVLGDGQTFATRQNISLGAKLPAPIHSAALRTVLRNSRANHYPTAIFAAMVDPTVVLDEVSNRKTGESRLVTPVQRRQLMLAALPGKPADHPWSFVRRFKTAGALLTLSAKRARQFGVSAATVRSRKGLFAVLNVVALRVPVLGLDWLEEMVRVLVSPGVRFILMLVLVIAGWLTLTHPGWHLPLLAGIFALALLLGAPMLTGVGQLWEIVMVIIGGILILVDIFHFGGLGLLAIPGFVLVLVGVGFSLVPIGEGFTSAGPIVSAAQLSAALLAVALFSGIILSLLLVRFMHLVPGARRLVLMPPRSSASVAMQGDGLFIGAVGKAASNLHPAGKGIFDGHLADVVTHGEYISSGKPIVILGRGQNQILVKALD